MRASAIWSGILRQQARRNEKRASAVRREREANAGLPVAMALDRCFEARVPGRAHGLRKAGATVAANNGATAHQLMAMFG
jgi:hypothetical protein